MPIIRAPPTLASLLHIPTRSIHRAVAKASAHSIPGGINDMWKKDEGQSTQPSSMETPQRVASPRPTSASSASATRATIGPSISIKGDVTGSEDLLIQGQVDGSVTLDQHAVTVGGEGRVNADIRGRIINVEGRVEGDLTADEQIILRGSAHVHGDIKAPRVVLEDGATFRGLVDMGATPKQPAASKESKQSPAKTDTASAKGSSTSSEGSSADKDKEKTGAASQAGS